MAEWIVDGNNVMGSRPDGWWRDRHGAQRRLVARLETFAEARDEPVTVIFDGRAHDAGGGLRVAVRFARRSGRDAADDDVAAVVARHPDAVVVEGGDVGCRARRPRARRRRPGRRRRSLPAPTRRRRVAGSRPW